MGTKKKIQRLVVVNEEAKGYEVEVLMVVGKEGTRPRVIGAENLGELTDTAHIGDIQKGLKKKKPVINYILGETEEVEIRGKTYVVNIDGEEQAVSLVTSLDGEETKMVALNVPDIESTESILSVIIEVDEETYKSKEYEDKELNIVRATKLAIDKRNGKVTNDGYTIKLTHVENGSGLVESAKNSSNSKSFTVVDDLKEEVIDLATTLISISKFEE